MFVAGSAKYAFDWLSRCGMLSSVWQNHPFGKSIKSEKVKSAVNAFAFVCSCGFRQFAFRQEFLNGSARVSKSIADSPRW
jgi:hypothetical protein